MPPQETTGKQRAARIPLDYWKTPDFLGQWKSRLGWLALIVPLVWMGTSLAFSRQFDFYSSRGPVAAVHQTWNAQCSACHVDFTPISSNSWASPFLHDSSVSSTRCQSCHAGPDHFKGQADDRTCASCHREHRGPDASLVNLPDSDCTQCHKDLKAHLPATKVQNAVTGFTMAAHPDFPLLRSDPGKLKFNHKQHLALGMAVEKDGVKGGEIFTLGKIPESLRKRYRDALWQEKKTDDASVQLNCASCHQLDAGDFGGSADLATGRRNAGAYMLPITYENQCQACHPLTIERKVADDPKLGHLAVPHRLQPKEIHEMLEDFFTAQIARGQAGFEEKKVRPPLPGKIAEFLEPKVREAIHKKVEFAEKDLYLSNRLCAECHYFDGKSVAEAVKPGKAPDLRVAPTNVPTVWFQHAKFNHTAHRAVHCADCHADAEKSTSHLDVLIPNQANCVQCHAAVTKAGTPGARHNCTECHQYHHGEQPLQGVGAAKRNPKELRGIDGFMSGK